MQSVLDTTDAYPQLFFPSTPSLLLARHSRGRFTFCEEHKLACMKVEARSAQESLRSFGVFLEEVRDKAMNEWEGKGLSLVFRGGRMAVHERKGGVGLPDEMLKHFV